ncbi:MAG: class I SAM-dependent methyltransferase [Pseudomonadota bacterium]
MSQAYNEMSYVEVSSIYNDINNIPLEAARALGDAVAEIAGDGARIMDFGGGAGRISVPSATRTKMITVDIEYHMLKASKALAAQRDIPMQLSVGTVLQLPFANDTFDAIITTNVLHQVDAWREALVEAARVLKPGGVFIIGRDILDEESCAGQLRHQSRMMTAQVAPEMRPTDAAGPTLFQHIAQMGGQPGRPVTACSWVETVSPSDILERMASRTHNETWSLNDEQLAGLMGLIRPWAEEHFEDLERKEDIKWEFGLYPVVGLA